MRAGMEECALASRRNIVKLEDSGACHNALEIREIPGSMPKIMANARIMCRVSVMK